MRALLLTVTALLLSASLAHAVEKTAIDAAVDKGVAALKKMQRNDGTWPYEKIGATALAGLTLLECGVKEDDRAVKAAAEACRKAALTTLDTYSISLIILLIVNLLAGQNAGGGWSYECVQSFTQEEIKTTAAEASDKVRELRGARDLSKLPAKGKRTSAELPKLVQAKLVLIAKGGGNGQIAGGVGDNSNTQFGTLALWAGRRYGVPVQPALAKVEARFRGSQYPDGSWGYSPPPKAGNFPNMNVMPGAGSSAAMTCAGLLGLACGHGAKADVKKEKEKDKDGKTTVDLSGDARVKAGLLALSTAVGSPVGWKGDGDAPRAILVATNRAYYYLWSLERICVILGLDTLGKKDWYNWGAEILLKNQRADGLWAGDHAESGADTCFALLFLKKANLARDLSSSLTGAKDPGLRTLKSGGVGGGGLKGVKPLAPLDVDNKPDREKKGAKTPSKEEKKPLSEEQKAAAKVGGELVGAKGKEREGLLKKLRDTKGAEYTEALAAVIPKLDAESKKLAREALADRLTVKTANTIDSISRRPTPRSAAPPRWLRDRRTPRC